MEEWEKFDPAGISLSQISKQFKSQAVKDFATKMRELKIWRGGKEKKIRKPKRADSMFPRRRKSPKLGSGPPSPSNTSKWSKEEREVAAQRKAKEAADAASKGVRQSGRASVPSEKALNAQ